MFRTITIEELIPQTENGQMTLIDVRSPSEYREFTMPGSINIPIFNDEERAEVGTLYTQESVEAAKERGLEIVSQKLPSFIRAMQNVQGEKTVFCWRGGMRSKTAATLADLAGLKVNRLEGGIRAYRKWTVSELEAAEVPEQAIILNGLTGSGKTKVLEKLTAEGYPVIDLEGMAGHKGSIFGHIADSPNNQKTFDALLVRRLRELKDEPYVLFEAENSRIGKVVVPPFLMELKETSPHIDIRMPVEKRIEIILEDYQPEKHQQECLEAFSRIRSRIHTPVAGEIGAQLEEGNFAPAVRLLLEHYYDARYAHKKEQLSGIRQVEVAASDLEEAAGHVKKAIEELKRETDCPIR
ncbi:tRNA 2-selenouridine(34) synthase MnmH [Indiicoccus explosivorum]|uniref:tRNA 2-selenouridine(34) synthase MnmH n=1 Tax=Indiicoccus explosivorum TaxID=1917864 RepID=UPI000B44D283|nr:tRNA 2-selenouridine(34) synthase MnmH [Indiicoccus explosivorum]